MSESEPLEISFDFPICQYVLQAGKRKGVRCSQPVSKKCEIGCYCCSHYRIRSRKGQEPEPQIVKYSVDLLEKFNRRWEKEEEDRLYNEWKVDKGFIPK